MKILLFGANGQVGTELRRSLAPLGEVIPATRDGLLAEGSSCQLADFDQPGSLSAIVERTAPDIVVNAAAYTAVDRAEDDVAAAFRVNAEAPDAIAKACAARDILFVHYSTDYVFNGNAQRPYREDDPTNPLGIYGASKLAGERAIQASDARHLIFRTAWVYATHGRNFLLTMLRLAKERDELRVVADQTGTPTSARLIADTTADVLVRAPGLSGLWHLTARGNTNWHGFAEAIVEGAFKRGLLARGPLVVPIRTADFATRARRPVHSELDCTRLQADFGIVLPRWSLGLDTALDDLAR